ncbi:FecR family protein [uncultured Croceitalea sp.]|uniref:FecR family protein n=1 Tax=uncultured Croceitalea sp. TaxID=1798908 RepID=UPI00374F30B2
MEKIENIIIKHFSKSATISELEELTKWLDKEKNKLYFKEYVKLNYYIDYNLLDFELSQEREKILKRTKLKRVRLLNNFYKYAAAIVVLISLGYFILTPDELINEVPIIVNNDIKIGTDKAILTTENGKDFILEEGKQFMSDNVSSDGKTIVYKSVGKDVVNAEIAYNYITVPRGGQFYIKLSDNTKIWLNSDSKIKYPKEFVANQDREVELIYGEAYFDVSPSTNHNGSKFKLLSRGQKVEVLGTEFNVKAYQDEIHTYTTLVEGKVQVFNAKGGRQLAPGQQSIVNVETLNLNINEIDVYNHISWKDGVFSFKSVALKDIVKVLERWYDVEITIENKAIEDIKFIGVFRKDYALEKIIKQIKNTNFINAYEINNQKISIK